MKNRLFKDGIVTTVLGFGILAFCAVMMYQEKASEMELAGFLGMGLTMLRSKDSLIGRSLEDKDNGIHPE